MDKTEQLREQLKGIIMVARQEGPQSAVWKLDGDVDEILQAFKDAGGAFVVENAKPPDNEAWHKEDREYEAFCAGQNSLIEADWRKVEDIELTATGGRSLVTNGDSLHVASL